MANSNDEFDDDDDEIDWSSIPLNSISASMAVPTTTSRAPPPDRPSPTAAAADDDDDDVNVLRRKVHELRRSLEAADDRLLELESDAAASRIESDHRTRLVEKNAEERIRHVEDELRRTRIEAERYRGGWMRMSSGRRKRAAAEAESAGSSSSSSSSSSGAVGGGDDDDDDGRRGGRNNAKIAMASDVFSSWGGGGILQPVPVDRSAGSSREVTPRSGDEGGGGGRRCRGDDRRDDGKDGPSSSGNKRKARSTNDDAAVDDDDDDASRGPYPHGSAPFDGGDAGMIASGVDSLRMRIAARLLNREEDGCRCSPFLFPGIVDRDDDDGSSSTTTFAMADANERDAPASSSSPAGPLDATAEDGATTMRRRDRAIETEARTHVRSILRQMAEYPPAGEYDESAKGGLSVSGLLRVLMTRFNSLFRRATNNDEEDGTTGSSSASSGKNDGEYRRMALAISEGLSSNENDSSHLGPVTYTVVSWGAASYLLSVIHDILLLSGNTRDDVRWWFYQSRQSFGSGDGGGGGSYAIGPGAEVDVGFGGTSTAALRPRIEGLTATGRSFRWSDFDRKEALRTANNRLSSGGKHSNDWDPMTMTQPVNLFFELLVGLMKGNVFDLSDCPNTPTGIDFSDSKSERTLVKVIQLKAIDLVLALMSDAPPYDHAQDDHSNRTPYLWKFWFDSLIPSDRSSRPSLGALPIGDFFSPWEKRDIYCGNYLLGSGRIHSTKLLTDSHTPNEQNKRGAEKQGRAGNKPSRADSASESSRYIDGNSKLHWHLSILVKDRILQLLSHFVLSSSSVNQSLYRIPDGGKKTSFAKRILAAILDQMDEYIVPYLFSGPSSDVCAAKLSADRCLCLCYRCIQFLLIMSRSNEGIRLLRLQMRIESNEDEPSRWLQSSIGCMTAVLNGILSFAMQVEEMDNTDFARLLTSIVDQCIAFFKSLLLFVEQQRKSSSKSTTFLVLTSEHRTIFQSCCQRILSHQSPNKVSDPPRLLRFSEGLKYDVRCILEQLIIDVDGDN